MRMRIILMIIGVILLGFGIWVLAGPGTYVGTETGAEGGSLSLQGAHRSAAPQWAGIAGIVIGGVVLIAGIAGSRKR